MLTTSLIGFAFLFIVHLGLLVSLNMRSNWHWIVKSIAIMSTLFVWIVGYSTITSYSGFPGPGTQIPTTFQFLWSHERQPTNNSPGSIYMWVIPKGEDQPRGYQIKYSKQIHLQLLAEKKKICEGKKRYAEGAKKKGHQMLPSQHQGFKFTNPVDLLPPKN